MLSSPQWRPHSTVGKSARALFPIITTEKQYQTIISNPTHHEGNRAANELQEMFNLQALQDYLTGVAYRPHKVRPLTEILERKQSKSKWGRPRARTANANDESASQARKLGDCEKHARALCEVMTSGDADQSPLKVTVISVYGYNEKAGRRFLRTPGAQRLPRRLQVAALDHAADFDIHNAMYIIVWHLVNMMGIVDSDVFKTEQGLWRHHRDRLARSQCIWQAVTAAHMQWEARSR